MKCYACDQCLTVVRVHGPPEDVRRLILDHSLWKDGRPCVHSSCDAKLYELTAEESEVAVNATTPGVIRVLNLTAQEFFSAMCGYGLPDELGTSPEVVKALLLSSKIMDVSVGESPSGRTVVYRLDLENGTSLHLASSSHGPSVFKVTRRSDVRAGNDIGVLQQDPEDRVVRDACRCDQGVCGCGGRTSELHESRDIDGKHDR